MPADSRSLVTVKERPFNAETPLSAVAEPITPLELFFVRSNFDVPVIDADSWTLEIGGAVQRPLTVTLRELKAMPRREVTATVECAGNGRKLMQPVPAGTPWNLGAVSTGRFAGAALRDVLAAAGVSESAMEVVFEGADSGRVENGSEVGFARSLPLARAIHADTLVAWELNGAPLTPDHGYPVRLFVPGYYGVASVKWLRRITVVEDPFTGWFQTDRYVYNGHPAYEQGTPVTLMQVRALFSRPAAGDELRVGVPMVVEGAAWSGFAPVSRVELSFDGGSSWVDAQLGDQDSSYAPRRWRGEWTPGEAGSHELLVRAHDASGGSQPLEPVWNELGYGNNVAQRLRITVTE
jgi:sulfite oxidase